MRIFNGNDTAACTLYLERAAEFQRGLVLLGGMYLEKYHVQVSRMKTFRHPFESNGRDCGFVKSALYILEVDDKYYLLHSGECHMPISYELMCNWTSMSEPHTSAFN